MFKLTLFVFYWHHDVNIPTLRSWRHEVIIPTLRFWR